MKKFMLSFALILMSCVCLFAGCGEKGLKDNPPAKAAIYGNGGNGIVKGDYLYYINGFVDNYTEVYTNKKQNNWGKVNFGAIYRTKLNNGEVQKDEKGFLKNTEVVVPRLVGFENGKFCIIGNYIYYSTPRMREDSNGKVRNDYIEFNKVKIDGTNNDTFYVASSQVSTDNWNVYSYNGKDYLVIVETTENNGNVIKKVDIAAEKAKVVAKNVTSWALPDENLLEVEENNKYFYNQYIYYTRAIVESDELSDSGNVLVKSSLVDGKSSVYTVKQNTTKTIVALDNDMLYYSVEETGANKDLYATDITLNVFNENNMSRLTTGGYASFYVVPDATLTVVAVDEDKNVYLCVNGNTDKLLFEDGKEIKILGFSGQNILYLDSENNIKLKNYVTGANAVSLMTEGKTYLINENKITITNGKVYLFAEYTSKAESKNYYLNYISLSNIEEGTFVGKFMENHLPEAPKELTDDITGETYTPAWVK